MFVVVNPCPDSNIDPSSGFCFLPHPDNVELEFTSAFTACRDIGMEMAIVNTSEKQTFIKDKGLLTGIQGY